MADIIFKANAQADPLKQQIDNNNLIKLLGLNPEIYDDSIKDYDDDGEIVEEEEPEESEWSKAPVDFLNKIRQYDMDDRQELTDEYKDIDDELKNRNMGGKYGLGEAFDFAVMDYIYNNNFSGLQSYFTNEANKEFTKKAKELEEAKAEKERLKDEADAKADKIAEAKLELKSIMKKRLNSTNLNERAELEKEIQNRLDKIYGDDDNKDVVQKSIFEKIKSSDDRINQIKKFMYDLDEVRTDGKLDYKKYNKKFNKNFKNKDDAILDILQEYRNNFGENGVLKDDFAEEQYNRLLSLAGYESDYEKAYRQSLINQKIKDEEERNKARKSLAKPSSKPDDAESLYGSYD